MAFVVEGSAETPKLDLQAQGVQDISSDSLCFKLVLRRVLVFCSITSSNSILTKSKPDAFLKVKPKTMLIANAKHYRATAYTNPFCH